LRLRRDGPPECLPKRLPDDVVPRKTSAIQGRAVAFEQDAIRCEDTDQLKHLVQRDAGQPLQILLRRVVWANLGPANEGVIDFGDKELHRSITLDAMRARKLERLVHGDPETSCCMRRVHIEHGAVEAYGGRLIGK
jgi:hypothetical protein